MKRISTYLLLGCLSFGTFACGQGVPEGNDQILTEEVVKDSPAPVEATAPVLSNEASTESATPTPVGPVNSAPPLLGAVQPVAPVDGFTGLVLQPTNQNQAPTPQLQPAQVTPSDVLSLF